MIEIAKISLLVFAALVCAGGVMGFVKARSKASLISGIVSAVVLIGSYAVASADLKTGIISGLVASLLLTVVFAIRLAKTKKFMPSGLMIGLSVIECAILIYAASKIA